MCRKWAFFKVYRFILPENPNKKFAFNVVCISYISVFCLLVSGIRFWNTDRLMRDSDFFNFSSIKTGSHCFFVFLRFT